MEREYNPGDLAFGFQFYEELDGGDLDEECPGCGAVNWEGGACRSCGTEVDINLSEE